MVEKKKLGHCATKSCWGSIGPKCKQRGAEEVQVKWVYYRLKRVKKDRFTAFEVKQAEAKPIVAVQSWQRSPEEQGRYQNPNDWQKDSKERKKIKLK